MPNRPLVAPQVQSISFDPAAAMQDVASIQINRQRMDDARRKSMAAMRMRQLAQQYPDSPLEFVDAVTREFPEEGFALGESYWKGVKENAQAHKAQTESSVANLEVGTRILQAARQNPALYSAAKQWITKMSPEVGSQLSEQYNEQEVDGWLQTGQKTSDFLKAQADAAERLTKQDTRGSVLTLFAGASNPQQWQTAVDLTTRSGLKPLLGLVASEWSPEAQAAAAQASISPEKQADDARAAAAEKRLTEAQAETVRHNRVSEGISGAHLAVSRATEARLAKGGAAGGGTRPVTSGDANRLAEIDTSLDDVATLKKAMSTEGSTGTVARIGAALPNIVTEFTGIGAEAKSKQAVIDRVKQVIGKALEGGVLRKEDEYKYTKILPTISDPPSVVTTKLEGLKTAITQKKERHLESLEDAGYNTSAFRARTPTKTDEKKANTATTPTKIGRFTVAVK